MLHMSTLQHKQVKRQKQHLQILWGRGAEVRHMGPRAESREKQIPLLKHSNKRRSEKCYVLIKKDRSKVKNTLLQWILQNILENQMFQRIVKFIWLISTKTDFIKGIVILVKVDEMYNILKSASH